MKRTRSKVHPGAPLPRADRRIPEHAADAYQRSGKLPDPTVCPTCGLMFRNGRWQRGTPAVDAHRTPCPACQRIEDAAPAGSVVLEGEFLRQNRDEIEGLIRNVEARESDGHPLKRIMRIESHEPARIEVTTTDARLARAIADAVERAYQGDLRYEFDEPENPFRAHWVR